MKGGYVLYFKRRQSPSLIVDNGGNGVNTAILVLNL